MSDDEFARMPRIRSKRLEHLLDSIGQWLREGDLTEQGWFKVPHDGAVTDWLIKVDVVPPLKKPRYGHGDTEDPCDPHQMLRARSSDAYPDPSEVGEPKVDPRCEKVRDRIDEALAELDAEERACIEAVVIGGLTVRQAADAIGVSYPTLWRRVQSAKKNLAAALGDLYES